MNTKFLLNAPMRCLAATVANSKSIRAARSWRNPTRRLYADGTWLQINGAEITVGGQADILRANKEVRKEFKRLVKLGLIRAG